MFIILIVFIIFFILFLILINENNKINKNIIYFKKFFNNNLTENNIELFNNEYIITKNFIKNNDNFLELILKNNDYEFSLIEYDFNDNIIQRTKERITEWNNNNYVLKEKKFKLLFRLKDKNKQITKKDINIINKYLSFIIHKDDSFINKKFTTRNINELYNDFKPFEFYDNYIKFNMAESHYNKKIKLSINNNYLIYCKIYNKYNQNIYDIKWSNTIILEPNIRYIIFLTENNNINLNNINNDLINLNNDFITKFINEDEIINLLQDNNFIIELIN